MRDRLAALDEPVRVAIIGVGAMGRGLAYQCSITPGIDCVALVDLNLDRAISCATALGQRYDVTDTPAAASAAIRRGRVAVCEDGEHIARAEGVDVFVEASSAIVAAGRHAETALRHGKHLVLMNSEIDLTFGPYLYRLAQERGLLYTSCDGDQHGVIAHLVEDLELWGMRLVMAGNIKGYLARDANPTNIVPEADKRRLDYRMCTAYTDGTKLAVEMALVANAFGCGVAAPGMLGPRAGHVREVLQLYDWDALGWQERPVVDYILGAEPGGGVFAVGYCDDRYQREMLAYYKMGDGPYYLFYRPYHLCHIESMACIAQAHLDHRAVLQPRQGWHANVFAYAKRDLRRGERLDGVGGYTCYGIIDGADGDTPHGLPICLADDVTLRRDVPRDAPVLWDDVEHESTRDDYRLFALALEAGARMKA